ncbi:hypothetical protein [Agrobacterium arsenijevicii]|uniref:hypothetical protein n=1 Tax=Agrobacterium arsenijevicii TaxID=1585697 RepID=UPI0033067AF1
MTVTNSFIAELVRDANRLENLDDYQKRRMLERAVTTIRDMRETIGIPSGPGRDSVVDIHTVALSIERSRRFFRYPDQQGTVVNRCPPGNQRKR